MPRSPALTSQTLIALGPERLAELLLELGRLTEAAPLDPATLAEQVFEAFCDNGYGVFDGVIGQLKQALGPEGLALLKSRFEQLAEQPVPVPPRQEWQQVGWGSGGPTYAHEREESSRQWTVKLGLQDVTTAMGDIDAYIAQYTPEQQGYPRIAAGIARRLLAVGRPEDALAFLSGRTRPRPPAGTCLRAASAVTCCGTTSIACRPSRMRRRSSC